MIITIDTSKENEQDILKLIDFLSSLVDIQSPIGQYQQASPQPDITPQAGDAFTQMFDNPVNQVPTEQAAQNPDEELHKVVEDNKENPPKIVYYSW